jgi:hypothetical protein
MTNDEAAKMLDDPAQPKGFYPVRYYDACEMGAQALRENSVLQETIAAVEPILKVYRAEIDAWEKESEQLKARIVVLERKLKILQEHIAFDVEMRKGAMDRLEGK